MSVVELREDNIDEYLAWVDEDNAEDMSRAYYRGIAYHDDESDDFVAALIWQLKSVESTYDTEAELEWFYCVEPEHLNLALKEYKKRAKLDDVTRTYFENTELNDEMCKVLKKRGFKLSEVESREVRVSVRELSELSIVGKKVPQYVQSIGSILESEFNQGMARIIFKKNVGALEDMCYLPKEWYDQNVSCCVKTDGKVNGLLLVHTYPSGIITPVLFYATGPDYKYNLAYMLRFSIQAAIAHYRESTTVLIRRRTGETKNLFKKLFPKKTGEMAVAGERTE